MPPPPSASAPEQPPPPPSASSPVVLVLDDDELVRRALQRVLEHSGFEVLLTNNTTQAYTVLISCRVDCVVADLRLDWRSGKRDGLELLDDVAIAYPHCGRVLYSGHTSELEPRVFADHAVVAKGWWPYQLIQAIANEIERRRSVAPRSPPAS